MTGLAPNVTLGTQVLAATYRTGLGEIRTFALADGSRVTLDTNSRIRVSISSNERHVVLDEGRARFKIRNAFSSPFIVVTRAGKVIAQGQVFDVSAVGPDIRVAVPGGKAIVESNLPGDVAGTLTAGHQADLGGTLDPSPVSRAEAQWTDGPPRDASDRELLELRSCGRCVAVLYNEDWPHGAVGNKPPITLMNPGGAPSPVTVIKAGKL